MVAQVRYSVAGRSGGRVTPCAIYMVHVERRNAGFLVEPQNQGRWFVSGLASKPLGRFLRFGLKTSGNGFLVEPQNQGGVRFPSLSLKTGSSVWIWATKSSRRFLDLVLKTKQVLVCRLRHKTDGRAMAWDTRRDLAACFMWKHVWLGFSSLASRLAEARWRVVHVAPLQRLRQSQVKYGWVNATGCVGSCYPYFVVSFC
jgi:hypothetical protein